MIRFIPVVAVLVLLAACSDNKPAPVAKVAKDPKIAAIEERIAKTTAEGKEVIQRVQAMKPLVQTQLSTKTLKEMADHYEKEMGAYNITPIGWEAAQKKLLPGAKEARWKVALSYQDYQKQVLTAEWEYDPETKKVYPFEEKNAVGFYEPAPEGKKSKK